MKKIKLLLFLLLYVIMEVNAQTARPIVLAHMHLNKTSRNYNPQKSIELFTAEAEKGNAQAMNALGIIYSKGLGTEVDPDRAISWFEKAGQHKYAKAWYNLGLIYKNGVDVPQDFAKAVACFSKGSELNSSTNHYSLGYMKYKGLGCGQSYEEAVPLFRKGIKGGSLGSMYMLGLCFRNGYGLVANVDSARYWLEKSAAKGYSFAKEEMREAKSENISAVEAKANKGSDKQGVNAAADKEFSNLKHQAGSGNISGTYTGYLIRYDWSGKNVIGKSQLKLTLNGQQENYNGDWAEDETLATAIQGKLTDTALIFSNTDYERTDHYSAKKPATFEFRNAHLQVVKTGDSVFLMGTVQQFSMRQNEPEKPIYISLFKEDNTSPTQSKVVPDKADLMISNVVVFPNPFSSNFQVSFNLKTAKEVTIYLADLMGGTIYLKTHNLTAGEQNVAISTEAPRGTYVLKVQYGKEVHSTVLIKQ